jgi:hypothetical protein
MQMPMYKIRRMQTLPFVLGAGLTAGIGAAVAIRHSFLVAVAGVAILFNFLIWLYLSGPSASLAIRGGQVEVRNPLRIYTFPPQSVIAVESIGTLGVRASLEGRTVWISALSPGTYRLNGPSSRELDRRARELQERLQAASSGESVDTVGRVSTRPRWLSLIAAMFGVIALIVLLVVARHRPSS